LSVIAEEEAYQSSNSFNNKLQTVENNKIYDLKKMNEKNSFENLKGLYQKSMSQSITEYDEINSANLTSSNEPNLTERISILDRLDLYADTEEDDNEEDNNIQIIYI